MKTVPRSSQTRGGRFGRATPLSGVRPVRVGSPGDGALDGAVALSPPEDGHRDRREDGVTGGDATTGEARRGVLEDDPEEDELLEGRVQEQRDDRNRLADGANQHRSEPGVDERLEGPEEARWQATGDPAGGAVVPDDGVETRAVTHRPPPRWCPNDPIVSTAV